MSRLARSAGGDDASNTRSNFERIGAMELEASG
jgi:hypothetical protein